MWRTLGKAYLAVGAGTAAYAAVDSYKSTDEYITEMGGYRTYIHGDETIIETTTRFTPFKMKLSNAVSSIVCGAVAGTVWPVLGYAFAYREWMDYKRGK